MHLTSPEQRSGLTTEEATRRLAQFGPNDPVHIHRLSVLMQIVRLFANPLVGILLAASAISASLGQRTDATLIVTIVLIGISVNFWQSFRSQRTADRLRASVAPTATVERDGTWQEIPIRSVVPGASAYRPAISFRRMADCSSLAICRCNKRCSRGNRCRSTNTRVKLACQLMVQMTRRSCSSAPRSSAVPRPP